MAMTPATHYVPPRLIKTSKTTGTYSAKLNELNSSFNSLTDDEKSKSYIVFSGMIYRCMSITTKRFGAFAMQTAGTVRMQLILLDGSSSMFRIAGITPNNTTEYLNMDTTTSDGNAFELYVAD